MRFDVITIFPKLFDSFLSESLIAKAQKKGLIDIQTHNLRQWTTDKHHKVDDHPYGGGPGMILKVEPIVRALRSIASEHPRLNSAPSPFPLPSGERIKVRGTKIIMLDPAGKQFDQKMAEKFSKLDRLVLLCGRYEGFDYRVTKFVDERVSVGPYVLNGGEVPAMVLIEAVARLVPGFVGKPESLQEETFAKQKISTFNIQHSTFVEYPQYTRPEIFEIQSSKNKIKNLRVPKVLLSGDHKKIKEWREKAFKIIMMRPTASERIF